MQNNKKSFSRAKVLLLALFALGSAATNAQTTYSYTGGVQTYTVPVGVTSIQLECWGAQGSGGNGGLGGYAKGNMTVTPGQVLNVYVGGQTGYNGGGAGHAVSNRNGGGASDIRVSPYALADRVIVAGAGGAGGQTDVGIRNGGAGGGGTVGVNYAGGGGGDGYGGNGGPGGLNGGAGNTSCHSGGAGGGGLNSGGAPSCNTCYTSTCGQAGTLGQGGAADVWENGICYNSYGGTNGGGGGYYGGGGSSVGNCGGGGGGGGSSWVGTLSNTTMTGGTRAGNGQIVITVLTTPGAALNFDGTDDYVNLGTAPALDLTGDMTVETWIYPNTGANGAFFFNGGGWGIPGYAFMLFGTTLRVELHNGSTGVQANNTVSINNAWHHVAFTRVASTGLVRVYLDGVLLSGTATLPGALGLNPGNATLGAYIGGSGAYFNGSMDETRVWNRALCDGEIQNNMNCQIPTNGTGLVANYHYNQGIAAGANGSVTTLNDATSNAVNGTLTSMGLSAATSNWIAPGGVVTGTTCGAFVPPAVTVTPVSQTNIACFGGASGAASVSTVGSGLTYNWTPGNPTGDGTASVSGLTAGTWTCTVTNSCGGTGTQTFNITQPPVLVVSPTSQTNISCFGGAGGAASVSVTGGTPTYSYNWTPGNPTGDGTASVTGLTAGTWTCTVTDANSCVMTQTFNITAPSAVVASAVSQTNISCFGGSNGAASVSVTGGTPTYSYNWTPGNPTGDGTASVTGLAAGTWTCTVTDANSCVTTQTFNITAPSALVVTPVSQTNISCFGGSNGAASVSLTGGTPTYSYNWTPGNPTGDGTASVTGLAAGTWTCTVTDANSCVTTQTFNVTAPSALVVTPASQTNISCNGGSNGAATINTPTGGAGGYTYNWTPGNPTGDGTVSVTGLSAGTWTCTVTDANSCVTTQTFNITAPSALVVSAASQTNVSCSGGSNGSATVSVSGGNPGYFYNWIPAGGNTATASGLPAGIYTCQIFDMNTCVTSQTFSITQPAPLVVTPASQTNISCFGGSNGAASVSVSGGTSSYSYNWAPGNPTGDGTASVTGLTAGTWSCTVTDANSCVTTQTLIISQPIALSVTGTSTNVSCNAGANGSATVSPIGGTTPYTYAWSPSGGTNATATGLAAGTYTCVTTDVNGCTTSYSVAITEPIALTVTSTATDVTCFGQNNGSASVSVSGGSSPYTYAWSPSGGTNATATGLGDGLFICTITDANGCIHTETVTINEPSLLSATSMQTNVSCNGGSNGDAMVMVTGGTGPYTYAWLPSGGTNSSASGLNAGTYTCTITDANGCTNTQTFNVTEPGVLTVTSSSAAISCNGGTTTVTVVGAGGTAPYTGEGSFTVTAGAYSYTVTDANGCTATTSITVTEPTALTATATATSILCDGGNATVTVVGAGGTAPYTGEGSFTELAGTYSYTVTDANGCTTTTSITITEPDPIGNSANITNVNCFFGTDGSIDLVSFGGTPGYTYDWNNGQFTTEDITGIAAGVYTVLITDANGCTHIDMVTVMEPSELIATLSTSTNPTGCGTTDGTIDISVAGGVASYTFLWNTSATTEDLSGIGAGAYTCTVTDAHGCTTTIGDNLSDPNAPTVTLALTADTLCSTDGAFTLTGESPAGGTFSGPGVTAGSFDPAAAGVGMHMISYTFTDISGCTGSTTDSIYVDVCTSSDIWNLRSEVSIYPNPNGGTFTLQTTSVADVMIYDAQGKLVYTQKVQANVATQMNIVESGMYMITVIDANGERTSQRVMVTR